MGYFCSKGLLVGIFIDGLTVLSLNRTKEYFERHPGKILFQRREHQLRGQSFPVYAQGYECLFVDRGILLALNGNIVTFTSFRKVLKDRYWREEVSIMLLLE